MKKTQKQQEKFNTHLKFQESEYDDIFQEQKTEPQTLPFIEKQQQRRSKIRIVFTNKPIQQQIPITQEPNSVAKRSWHKELDNLINPSEIKNGKFSDEEKEQIMKIVHNYQSQNNLSDQQLKDYIELKSLGHSKIWLEITKYIPTRTVDSVYKLIRRKLDSKNRQGYWNKEEEAELIKYVQQYGRQWREISKHINRTPDNIRNKYNQIGEQNHLFRNKSFWTIQEFLILINNIHSLSGYPLLLPNYDQTLKKKFGNDFEQVRFRLNYRKMKSEDKEIFNQLKSIVQIPPNIGVTIKWTEIASEIKTKTKDDLRQMWYKLNRNSQ
ncbi:unnamed protein product [Paramecium sonneborni]|uniref:Myb-like DNA-binding domain-containing protein n=1 Tax=Paramecium sonneborni TaxID=65129 RepID=A0A8S1P393_9CILI|nr:unnamed protein product [Paramecium sonneborni]